LFGFVLAEGSSGAGFVIAPMWEEVTCHCRMSKLTPMLPYVDLRFVIVGSS